MSDAPQHYRKEVLGGKLCLVPCDEETHDFLARRKTGSAVAMRADGVRNAEQSALYWVMCSIIAENHSELEDREAVSDAIKTLAGLCRVSQITLEGGEKMWIKAPLSISFAKMAQDEFERFFTKALLIIGGYILPGADMEELCKESYLRSGVSPKRLK